jgi:hypothetical protein
MLHAKVVTKIKIHILSSIIAPPPPPLPWRYEIICENVVEPEKPQMTIIRLMRFACWTTKAAHTHTHTHTQEYITVIALPRQQWLRERATLYVYCLSYHCCSFIIIAFANRHCETEDKLNPSMTESITTVVVTSPANFDDPLKRGLRTIRETQNRFNLEEAIKHCFRN